MRVSDWSSDVCSSDLEHLALADAGGEGADHQPHRSTHVELATVGLEISQELLPLRLQHGLAVVQDRLDQDRKRVVEGKSVSVRVDIGGRRIIKKKKQQLSMTKQTYTKVEFSTK